MSVFSEAVNTVLVSVLAQLKLTPAGFPDNARVYPVPGVLAWDKCECGLLAIETQTASYTSVFPNAMQPLADGCKPYLVLTTLVSILRCAPPVVKGDVAPSPQSLADAAEIMLNDIEACLRGTSLAVQQLEDTNKIIQFALGPVTPVGGAGGCVGITQQVFLGFANRWGPC